MTFTINGHEIVLHDIENRAIVTMMFREMAFLYGVSEGFVEPQEAIEWAMNRMIDFVDEAHTGTVGDFVRGNYDYLRIKREV